MLEQLVPLIVALPQVRGVFLSGSHARGTADAWSDLDLVIVAGHDDHLALAGGLRQALAGKAPLIMWRQQAGQTSLLVNAITADWARIDLLLEQAQTFATRAPDGLTALHDPEALAAQLTIGPAQQDNSDRRVAYVAEEFLRVLGLLAVGLGRGEWLLCTMGAGHLRDHLITLMRAEAGTLGEGALHLSRAIRADDMAVLMALPVPHPERDSVIAAHLALAQAFVPRAKAACAARGMAWPAAFEDATRVHLGRALGVDAQDLW